MAQIPHTTLEPITVETRRRWQARVSFGQLSWLLLASAALMVVAFLGTPIHSGTTGLVQMVETAGALERVALWQRGILDVLGMDPEGSFYSLPPGVIAYAARIAYIGMFLAQGWAFWIAWHGTKAPFWKWLLGPVGAHLLMLLMPPSNADIFFYEITGDLARNGINPYVERMSEFPGNPLLPYNHWVDMTAVYGPVWTSFNSLVIWITGPDPLLATLVFKALFGLVALVLAALVYWFVSRLTGAHHLAVASGVLVAWQPNLIVESTGLGHNDPVMMLLSTSGMVMVILGGTRAIRGGIVLVVLSALIKYTSLPLMGILGLTRLADRRERGELTGVFRSWILDGIAIGAVLVAAFAPFWVGTRTLREMITEPGRLFSSPLYLYPKVGLEHIGPDWIAHRFESITSTFIQLLVVGVVLATTLRFGKQMWNAGARPQTDKGLPVWTRPVLVSWAVILTSLALIPVNSHPWYWTWPIVPIAILIGHDGKFASKLQGHVPGIPTWLWGYLFLTGAMTIAYHTRIVHV